MMKSIRIKLVEMDEKILSSLFVFQILMIKQGELIPMNFAAMIFRFQQRNIMYYGLNQTLLFLIQILQTKIYIVVPNKETNSFLYHVVSHMSVAYD
jgi:hypothetical protein